MKNDTLRPLRRKILIQLLIWILIYSACFALFWLFMFNVVDPPIGTWAWRLFGDNGYLFVTGMVTPTVVILYAIGLLTIVYRVIAKQHRYMLEVVDAIDVVFLRDESMVALSPELKEVETKLNQMKYVSLKNEQLAKDAEQRKNDLVVYLAHDIKTPLTSVIGYLSLLDEAPDMPADQKARYVNITLEKAYRLETLIDEFFDITRFNLQSIVLEKETLDLGHMLNQMADEFYPYLAEAKRHATVEVEDGLQVYGDGDKLARVFNNILKNAVAYGYEGTTVEITGKKRGHEIVIAFKNSGRTIPPQKLETIFEKFYRLDSSRSGQTGGSGLGLAIAKEIVEVHGGTITVQSENEETVFTVLLASH